MVTRLRYLSCMKWNYSCLCSACSMALVQRGIGGCSACRGGRVTLARLPQQSRSIPGATRRVLLFRINPICFVLLCWNSVLFSHDPNLCKYLEMLWSYQGLFSVLRLYLAPRVFKQTDFVIRPCIFLLIF